jgi:hypothetical protein
VYAVGAFLRNHIQPNRNTVSNTICSRLMLMMSWIVS